MSGGGVRGYQPREGRGWGGVWKVTLYVNPRRTVYGTV